MLTLQDCVALSELTRKEIDAIAEHEHLPAVLAAELGNYLLHCARGSECIREMIRDDIKAAQERGDHRHSAKLKLVLRHFLETHPFEQPAGGSS
jgi:hypothetical protein